MQTPDCHKNRHQARRRVLSTLITAIIFGMRIRVYECVLLLAMVALLKGYGC
jgi:hypothetical protein